MSSSNLTKLLAPRDSFCGAEAFEQVIYCSGSSLGPEDQDGNIHPPSPDSPIRADFAKYNRTATASNTLSTRGATGLDTTTGEDNFIRNNITLNFSSHGTNHVHLPGVDPSLWISESHHPKSEAHARSLGSAETNRPCAMNATKTSSISDEQSNGVTQGFLSKTLPGSLL